jgi:hypothetical protein
VVLYFCARPYKSFGINLTISIGRAIKESCVYDYDAVTKSHELMGPGSYELWGSGDRYIVGVSIQQSGVASTSELQCGTTSLVKNYGKDFPYNELNYHCTDAVNITKTGQDDANFVVTVIDQDLSQYPASLQRISTDSGLLTEAGMLSRIGMQGLSYTVFFGFALVILMQAISLGTWIFQKRL